MSHGFPFNELLTGQYNTDVTWLISQRLLPWFNVHSSRAARARFSAGIYRHFWFRKLSPLVQRGGAPTRVLWRGLAREIYDVSRYFIIYFERFIYRLYWDVFCDAVPSRHNISCRACLSTTSSVFYGTIVSISRHGIDKAWLRINVNYWYRTAIKFSGRIIRHENCQRHW